MQTHTCTRIYLHTQPYSFSRRASIKTKISSYFLTICRWKISAFYDDAAAACCKHRPEVRNLTRETHMAVRPSLPTFLFLSLFVKRKTQRQRKCKQKQRTGWKLSIERCENNLRLRDKCKFCKQKRKTRKEKPKIIPLFLSLSFLSLSRSSKQKAIWCSLEPVKSCHVWFLEALETPNVDAEI